MPANQSGTQLPHGLGGASPSRAFGPLRWFMDLSLLGRGLVTLGALFGLICVFFAEENWRGKRAWETCRRELEGA
jgi:hypothetical protein